jgi:tRNA (guanine-N7-)-methyltransferase
MSGGGDERFINSFGRRRGRKLRAGRAALLDSLLPRLRIALDADDAPIAPATLFATTPQAVWLEIGFGAGEHLAWQAEHHPALGLIGCEPYVNGVVALLARVAALGLDNIRIWPDDARHLLARLAPASIARAFILFPDPWPKARHHKRRLIQTPFLDALARVLAPGAELRVASDDRDYLDWILARVPSHPAFGWADGVEGGRATRDADWPPTAYETWAIGEGRQPRFMRFVRR